MIPHFTDTQSGYAVAGVCVLALLLLIAAAVAASRSRRAPAGTYAGFTPPPPAVVEEVVWRVCDTTDCAHLTRRHTVINGNATCHECGTTRLDHQ